MTPLRWSSQQASTSARATTAPLDTLLLAAPIAFHGRLVQFVGPNRAPAPGPHPGKQLAEVHDYHDAGTGVLASSPVKCA